VSPLLAFLSRITELKNFLSPTLKIFGNFGNWTSAGLLSTFFHECFCLEWLLSLALFFFLVKNIRIEEFLAAYIENFWDFWELGFRRLGLHLGWACIKAFVPGGCEVCFCFLYSFER